MTKRDILSVALKILGIYLIVQGILTVINTPLFLFYNITKTSFGLIIPTVVSGLLELIVGYLLIKYTDELNRKLITEDKELQVSVTDDWHKELFIIALRIIGVYLLVEWLPKIMVIIGLYFYGETGALSEPLLLNIIRIVIMLGLNLYLILGAGHLAGLIYRKKDMV